MPSKTKMIVAAFAAIVIAVMAAALFGFSPSSIPQQNGAMAQSNESNDNGSTPQATDVKGTPRSVTYLSTQTVLVPAKGDADAEALCRDRDVVLSGGYTMGVYKSENLSSLHDTATLYSNTAVRLINSTTIHEGWRAGLVNTGTGNLTITANAICLDIN